MMNTGNVDKAADFLTPYERNIPESFEIESRAQTDWRFWETAAFYFGGVGAGLYVVSQFLQSLAGMIAGFVLVIVLKNGAHLMSASRPAKALRAFSNPRGSWVSRGAYFLVLFAVFGALDIIFQSGLVKPGWLDGKLVSLLALVFAAAIMIYIGFVLGQSRAIPLWHTPVLPVLLLTYSLAMGAGAGFLVQLFAGVTQNAAFLAGWLLISAGFTLLLSVVGIGMVGISSQSARSSVRRLTSGSLGLVFVGGALSAGLLIPIMLSGYALISGNFSRDLCFFIGILVLAGGFMFEWALLRAGVYNLLVSVD